MQKLSRCKRRFFRVRDVAASDEDQASCCFYSLLDYLEEQWRRSVQENNMLQGPDFAGMKDYLLVRCIILRFSVSVVMWPWCKSIFFLIFHLFRKTFKTGPNTWPKSCLSAWRRKRKFWMLLLRNRWDDQCRSQPAGGNAEPLASCLFVKSLALCERLNSWQTGEKAPLKTALLPSVPAAVWIKHAGRSHWEIHPSLWFISGYTLLLLQHLLCIFALGKLAIVPDQVFLCPCSRMSVSS